MRVFDRMNPYVYVQLVSAEPVSAISKLTDAGVELFDIQYVDDLTVKVKIRESRFAQVMSIMDRSGIACKVVAKQKGLLALVGVFKRPVFLAGAIVFFLIALFLPGRIFIVRVEGNALLSDRCIRVNAHECGIRFGSRARTVRSEQVKNRMLQVLPELQWVGVNTSGCVATIQVKERSMAEQEKEEKNVSSIIAKVDGVVCDLTALQGTPLCTPGQTVKAGDILISGYTDCGLKVQAQNASGEVFAFTLRTLSFHGIHPDISRGRLVDEHTCYRIKIGKKVINLCNHSGIPDTTCVKMYVEEFWVLPGGLQLPISLIREMCNWYDTTALSKNDHDLGIWLNEFADVYLHQEMVAGEILSREQQLSVSNSGFQMEGSYSCREMIGQVKYEETLEQNAEDS